MKNQNVNNLRNSGKKSSSKAKSKEQDETIVTKNAKYVILTENTTNQKKKTNKDKMISKIKTEDKNKITSSNKIISKFKIQEKVKNTKEEKTVIKAKKNNAVISKLYNFLKLIKLPKFVIKYKAHSLSAICLSLVSILLLSGFSLFESLSVTPNINNSYYSAKSYTLYIDDKEIGSVREQETVNIAIKKIETDFRKENNTESVEENNTESVEENIRES